MPPCGPTTSISWHMPNGNSYVYEKRGTEIFKGGNSIIVCNRRKLETMHMTISSGMERLV